MKQLYLFLVFVITTATLSAQDFSTVDAKIKTYPKIITANKLADKISADFTSDDEKVRAVFSWIAFNIRYDLKAFYNPSKKRINFRYRNEAEKQTKINNIKNDIVKKTMARRSGVCEGYAQTFSKICTLLNIENDVIKGHVRISSNDIGKVNNPANHAWNAVKLNNKWLYLDATWAAGAVNNGRWQRSFNEYYFNIPKEKYFLTHFPDDILWQLRVKRMSLQAYFQQPIYSSSFLKTSYKLITPINGIITKKANTPITFTLENIAKNQTIYCGFKGVKYAQKPKISFEKNQTIVSILPPKNSKEVYLIIDKEVMLEFLIK
ncbi:transglutaminase [Tenacibaculum pacificus]|uniref:transglutaminase domain-containing protein n=1 Tax=Tenacibaculum pacificus TaxID=3018314 RepID=UPI0022F3D44E|nr:transglutaminase domain-containing protein [Tenacibaculum pacificus]WBX73088.1 transglutaminase [Tenacibaculum pacificus]